MRHGYGTGRKYNNQPVTVGGVTYDSKKEAARHQELLMLEKAGVISDLRTQVKYVLIPAQDGVHRHERPCTYIADYVYKRDGKEIVEDSKGDRDAKYIIKRKLMLLIHGISVLET